MSAKALPRRRHGPQQSLTGKVSWGAWAACEGSHGLTPEEEADESQQDWWHLTFCSQRHIWKHREPPKSSACFRGPRAGDRRVLGQTRLCQPPRDSYVFQEERHCRCFGGRADIWFSEPCWKIRCP